MDAAIAALAGSGTAATQQAVALIAMQQALQVQAQQLALVAELLPAGDSASFSPEALAKLIADLG